MLTPIVLAQAIEIAPELTNLGAVGIIALALVIAVRSIAPLIALLASTFKAMQESNAALLRRFEQSDLIFDNSTKVIERNTNVIAGVPVALDKYAAESQQRAAALSEEVVTIRTDVTKLGTSLTTQLDALRAHITETGDKNTETVIDAISTAAKTLEEIKTQAEAHEKAAVEQSAALLQQLGEVERTITDALRSLTTPAPPLLLPANTPPADPVNVTALPPVDAQSGKDAVA